MPADEDEVRIGPVSGLPLAGVILVTGVMAAGKSTVAQLLAEAMPRSVHVRGDVFRRFIVGGRAQTSPAMSRRAREQLALRYRIAVATADAYAEAGFVAVVQDIILGETLRDVVGSFRTRQLFVVVLDADPSVIELREAGREKRGYVDGWTAPELVWQLRTTTPRLGLWIDTTQLTAHETVAAVIERLSEARIAPTTPSQ